jgi:CubicO group peptidase (beta-lactamase class C family)
MTAGERQRAGARAMRGRAPGDDERSAGVDRLPAGVGQSVRAAVAEALADGTTPGIAVAITDRERTLFEGGFGLAEVAAAHPVEPGTLFEVGSIGKSFTAFCVMALAEEGRLDPDDPVARHLPWFEVPPAEPGAPPITLHHLLSHTAGITAGIDATPEPASQVWALRTLRPSAPPGSRWHYSNVGYKALGLVLEAVEGRPYPEILRARLLDPLGMASSEPAITNAIRTRLAVGYAYLHDDRIGHAGMPLVPATWLETATADGSIAATAGDMAAYARLLLGRGTAGGVRVVGEASFARMTAPRAAISPDAVYGYGLVVRRDGDRTLLGHGGGMVGYLAGIQVDPEAGIGAVVLQNGPGGSPVGLARRIVRIVADALAGGGVDAGREPAAEVAEVAEPALPGTPDLAGAWVRAGPSAGPGFEIVEAPSGPIVRLGGDVVALAPWGEDRWLAAHPRFDRHLLVADRGPAGGGPAELWHGGDRYVRAGSTPRPLPAADPALAACAGAYRSHTPWTTNFRVVLRGDRLWLTFAEAPDGFEDEAPLVPLPDGSLRVGEDPGGPERLAFDTIIEGRPVRALLSGWPYHRTE